MKTSDLSFDRTPPYAVPLRFMLAAPIFGVAAGLVIAATGADLLASRWIPAMLGITHLVTLGVLAMTMFGAAQQILPVLAGADVPASRHTSRFVFLFLVPGAALLALGLFLSQAAVTGAGLVLAGSATAVFLLTSGYAITKSPVHTPTVPAMRLSLVCLAVTLATGLHLAAAHAGMGPPLLRPLTDIHAAFALVGWVGLLIIGVSYQVVPMFQITPDYPPLITRLLAPGIFVLLVVFGAGAISTEPWAWPLRLAAEGTLLTLLALFALVTLDLQRRRKRKVSDITLSFFRTGMACLLACVPLWLWLRFLPTGPSAPRIEIALGAIYIGGFALSVVNGMLYKIVPFLAWLHLMRASQQPGAKPYRVPNMKTFIPEKRMRRQLHLHHATLAAGTVALLLPAILPLAGLLLAASCALLAVNLFTAAHRYRIAHGAIDERPSTG